jgi:hypothetical protein
MSGAVSGGQGGGEPQSRAHADTLAAPELVRPVLTSTGSSLSLHSASGTGSGLVGGKLLLANANLPPSLACELLPQPVFVQADTVRASEPMEARKCAATYGALPSHLAAELAELGGAAEAQRSCVKMRSVVPVFSPLPHGASLEPAHVIATPDRAARELIDRYDSLEVRADGRRAKSLLWAHVLLSEEQLGAASWWAEKPLRWRLLLAWTLETCALALAASLVLAYALLGTGRLRDETTWTREVLLAWGAALAIKALVAEPMLVLIGIGLERARSARERPRPRDRRFSALAETVVE